MGGHHFVCYSPAEARDFAIRLHDELEAGPPTFSVWLDKRHLMPGRDWDEQVAEAIRSCESLLFLMTPDSVQDQSVCKQEWTRALKYKKPIIPILLDRRAEMPFRLGSRQHIDFTGEFEPAMARLRRHLQWLASPEGELQAMKDRLVDAQRDLLRGSDLVEEARITDEIALLEEQIADQQCIVDDPQGVARRVEESITRRLEREREPEKPIVGIAPTKFINPPPGLAPSYFQDRFVETHLVGDFLKDDSQRLMTVVGRAGIGKTAMVCRVLKALESGHLPDDGDPLSVDGIVYLSATGMRRVNFPNLYADLLRLLPEETARRLEEVYRNPQNSVEMQMQHLLGALQQGRVVLLLDNFEELIEPETQRIHDAAMREALHALLKLPHHAVTVILTTRIAPHGLALVEPGRQIRLELDTGLESPYAENILREMDVGGKVGLKDAAPDVLDEARRRTLGYPRALEALFAILSADRHTPLREVLDDAEKVLPQNVVEALVGEAYSRIDPTAQKIMQALAIYARPVTQAAVDFMLQPHLSGVDSAPVLNRLVNMHFARKEAGHYYLHPVDRAYAAGRIPPGAESDRFEEDAPPYTRFALLHRGAEYFKEVRKPRESWQTIEDLAAQLAEFDLRCEGQDYDTAAHVLLDIDFDYLFFWGHYRTMEEMHERLQGKLSDPFLRQKSSSNLALTLHRMGNIDKAVALYERVLAIYRVGKDHIKEGVILGRLGACYADLGQTQRAIDYYKEALQISRDVRDRGNEAVYLGNLATIYSDLGQVEMAIAHCKQALEIDRELGNRENEAIDLNNLGECYANIGQDSRALKYLDQSLTIAGEVGYRLAESAALSTKGIVLVNLGQLDEAKGLYTQAMEVGDAIADAQMQSQSRIGLAQAHLYSGDLAAARAVAEAAQQYHWLRSNAEVFGLLGVILLRRGEKKEAEEAFRTAVTHARAQLDQGRQDFAVLDAKGLALCGLALCGWADQVPEAIETYRAARATHSGAGVVARALRLFDTLAVCDALGVLAEVRGAAAGE